MFADKFENGALRIWLAVDVTDGPGKGSHKFGLEIAPDETVKVCARDRERYRQLFPNVPGTFREKFTALI